MHARGWTISVIARHLRRDRKTIRSYLTGQRPAGATRRAGPDQLEPFLDYCQRRFTDDPHLPISTLFEELAELGYQGAYSTLTKGIRRHDLRPHCDICHGPNTPTLDNEVSRASSDEVNELGLLDDRADWLGRCGS